MNCAICGIRKPKRHCPGVRGDICAICCGESREQTVDCPLDCEYLIEAHRHEKPAAFDRATLPNLDIELTDSFLDENQFLILLLSSAIAEGAREKPGCTDYDVRDALDSLVRTYRTLQSGLYYDSRPSNLFGAGIYDAVQQRVAELKKREEEARGSSTLRDSSVLGILAFLQRLEYMHNNGRKRSRAFLDFLNRLSAPLAEQPENSLELESPRLII